MPFVEGEYSGHSAGTGEAIAVPAPRSDARRIVKLINVYNPNAGAADLRVFLKDNGTLYQLYKNAALAAGGNVELPARGAYVLDAITKSIVVKLGGALGSELDITSHYGDAS